MLATGIESRGVDASRRNYLDYTPLPPFAYYLADDGDTL